MLFIAGLLSFALATAFAPLINWGIANYLPIDLENLFNSVDFLFLSGVTEIFAELANQLQLSIILPAGVMTIIGFALLLGVLLLARVPDQQIENPSIAD